MKSRKATFSEFYHGLRPAYQAEEIIQFVETSTKFRSNDPQETTDGASSLLLFEIRFRSSWLVKTNARLYKLIDDRQEDKPTINWSVSLERARNSEVHVTGSSASEKLMKISFGFREGRDYLVDPKLFQNTGIEAAIESFIGCQDKMHRRR